MGENRAPLPRPFLAFCGFLTRFIAFSSGDPASVQKLFNIICEGACVLGSRTRDIKEQMEKEFPGVQIKDFPRERLAELLTEEHEITTEPI